MRVVGQRPGDEFDDGAGDSMGKALKVAPRPPVNLDQSVMSHYWLDPAVKTKVDRLAIIGTLCSSMATLNQALFSARSKKDLTLLTDFYSEAFFWLPFEETAEQNVAEIRSALRIIGAGRGAQTTGILIAAVAVRHDAVVVHNDTDFGTLQRAVPELNQLRIGDADAG